MNSISNKVGNITPSIVVNSESRDPNELNKQVKIDFSSIVGEPETHQSPDWTWKLTSLCFTNVQSCTYKLLTIIFAPLFALIMAIGFALLAFLHIWCVRPLNKFFHVIFSSVRTFLEIILNGVLGPVFETIGTCFSNIKIRHQKVHDVRDEPQFPFII